MAAAMARGQPLSIFRQPSLKTRARRRRHSLKRQLGELCICQNLLCQLICPLSEWTASISTLKRLAAVACQSWTTDIPMCLLIGGVLCLTLAFLCSGPKMQTP